MTLEIRHVGCTIKVHPKPKVSRSLHAARSSFCMRKTHPVKQSFDQQFANNFPVFWIYIYQKTRIGKRYKRIFFQV